MDTLKQSRYSVDSSLLRSSYEKDKHDLFKEGSSEEDLVKRQLYSHYSMLLLFDAAGKDFTSKVLKDVSDVKILSDIWGRQGSQHYRMVEKLYVTPMGTLALFHEHYINIADTPNINRFVMPAKEEHSRQAWCLQEIRFTTPELKASFIENIHRIGYLNLKQAAKEKLRIENNAVLPEPILSYLGLWLR